MCSEHHTHNLFMYYEGFPSKHTRRLSLPQNPSQLPFISLLLVPCPTCLATSRCSLSPFNWPEIFQKRQVFPRVQPEKPLIANYPLFCSHTPQTCLSQLVFKTLYSFITESSGGHLTFVSSNRPLHYGSSHKLDLRSYFHPVQVNNIHKLSSRSNCS